MAADDRFEGRLEAGLHRLLDSATGPHPTWAEAPARRRAELEGARRRRPSGPLLLLAAALIISLAAGAVFVAGQHNEPAPRHGPTSSLAALALVTPAPMPSSSAVARPSDIPGVEPAPYWPIPGVESGNTATPSPRTDGVIDIAWDWGSLAWSPDGTILAAAAESQQAGVGQIHLFDRTGHPVGAVPGWRAVWLDDHELMTLQQHADGVGWSAWRWTTDGRTSALVVSDAADLLGSSRGAVAIESWPANQPGPTFRTWTGAGLSGVLPGAPGAWSPDGRTFAVLRDAGAAADPTSPGVVLASTGSVPPVWLQVLDASDLHPLNTFPASTFDPRTPVLFDPSGRWIATDAFVFDLAHDVAEALPQRSMAVAWGVDGRLIVASLDDMSIAAWDPTTQALGKAFAPGTQLSAADYQVVTVPTPTPGGDWPQLVTPGVVSPDGALRAWYPAADGLGNTPLRLVPEPTAAP